MAGALKQSLKHHLFLPSMIIPSGNNALPSSLKDFMFCDIAAKIKILL